MCFPLKLISPAKSFLMNSGERNFYCTLHLFSKYVIIVPNPVPGVPPPCTFEGFPCSNTSRIS